MEKPAPKDRAGFVVDHFDCRYYLSLDKASEAVVFFLLVFEEKYSFDIA